MIYPAYKLNPGDMFQVDVERVMQATGQNKKIGEKRYHEKMAKQQGRSAASTEAADEEQEAAVQEETPGGEAAEGTDTDAIAEAGESAPVEETEEARAARQDLHARVREALTAEANGRTSRALHQLARKARKLSDKDSAKGSSSVAALQSLLSGMTLDVAPQGEASQDSDEHGLTVAQRRRFDELVAAETENPHDFSKPYLTPWRPRPYMQPFAFIPRYLEVNQKVCSAIYLRHPVARQGMAEVPTPFPPTIGQLAFNWYLKRR
jgi:ribosomal protein S4